MWFFFATDLAVFFFFGFGWSFFGSLGCFCLVLVGFCDRIVSIEFASKNVVGLGLV